MVMVIMPIFPLHHPVRKTQKKTSVYVLSIFMSKVSKNRMYVAENGFLFRPNYLLYKLWPSGYVFTSTVSLSNLLVLLTPCGF